MPYKPATSARELLEVVAFFPQGVDEKNLDWLFPTISDRKNMFDKFCILSLTHRSNGFITMLAPIRDYLTPKDPKSSPLLRAVKDRYFSRLSVNLNPNMPGFEESGWIALEDANVEHLLDVFTSTDPDAGDIWDFCCCFMEHLQWHNPRQTVLRQKIEDLPDTHPSKPKCLSELSWLFALVGNYAEQKRLLTHALKLQRQQGDQSTIAQTLRYLSDVNRCLELHEEGMQQVGEALEILERLGDKDGQAICLNDFAWLLLDHDQFDAAEAAASRAIDLVTGKDQEFILSQLHRALGNIYISKGEKEKGIHHFETALGIASTFNWHEELFWVQYSLAKLFRDEDEFEDANDHIKLARSYAANKTYYMGRTTEIQAQVWHRQGRLEDATSEVLCALEVFEKLGATKDVGDCRDLLEEIEREIEQRSARDHSNRNAGATS